MGDKCATGVETTIRPPKEGTTIGTWNFRSHHACGKVQLELTLELTEELKRCRWDILCLSLVNSTGFGETTTDEGHKIWNCGEHSKNQYEVAFIARKEIVGMYHQLHSHLQQTHFRSDFSESTQ